MPLELQTCASPSEVTSALGAGKAYLGGGTLVVPAGAFRTGPITLVSNMTLEVQGTIAAFSNLSWSDEPAALPGHRAGWQGRSIPRCASMAASGSAGRGRKAKAGAPGISTRRPMTA